MSEFSDVPLVAGSLTGLRAFNVDRLGRLVSPQRPTIFTPGENVAECKKSMDDMWTAALSRSLMSSLTFSFDPFSPSRSAVTPAPAKLTAANIEAAGAEVEKPKHTAGNIECACGWYAYFDGSNEYKQPDRVSALIEGYGTCTLGTRGFRAEKSRLLGLVAPGRKSTIAPDRIARLVHNYPDVTVYATKREALEARPLTPPVLPTPETRDDFWTMQVQS